jgi:hypothetical protein
MPVRRKEKLNRPGMILELFIAVIHNFSTRPQGPLKKSQINSML